MCLHIEVLCYGTQAWQFQSEIPSRYGGIGMTNESFLYVSVSCPDSEDVAILDNVGFSLKAPQAGFLTTSKPAVFHKGFIRNGFCADELIGEIRVNCPGSVLGAHAFFDRPGSAFIVAHREERNKAHGINGEMYDAAADGFPYPVFIHEDGLFFRRHEGQFCFKFRTDSLDRDVVRQLAL